MSEQLSKETLTELAEGYQRQAVWAYIRYCLERDDYEEAIERTLAVENDHIEEVNEIVENHNRKTQEIIQSLRRNYLNGTKNLFYVSMGVGFYSVYLGTTEGFDSITCLIFCFVFIVMALQFYYWWKLGRQEFLAKREPITKEQVKEMFLTAMFDLIYRNEARRNEVVQAYSEGRFEQQSG